MTAPAAGPSGSAQASRMEWMDLLRGAAILLVLLWHAPAVPALYGFDMPPWLSAANDALLPFRMPALMFLSGLLLPRSLAKPLPTYLWGKARLLVWPYLIWAGLHMALVGPTAPVWHPNAWMATGYLWFLAFVIYYYLVALPLRRVPSWLVALLMFAASVPVDGLVSERLLYFGGFFFAGAWIARHSTALERVLRQRAALVGAAVVAGAVALVSATSDVAYDARFALGSFAGILAAISVARRFEGVPWAGWLRGIGRNSLVYYVSHYPVMLGVVALSRLADVEHAGVIAFLGLAAAVAVGAALVRLRRARPVVWLFEAPVTPRRPGRPAPGRGPELAPSIGRL